MTPKNPLDDAVLAILGTGNFLPTTDVDTARGQGIDVALRYVARAMPGPLPKDQPAMPKDHPGIVKHVIRDENGRITTVIEESATIREMP
jgi:hypothetical protein